MAQNSNITLKVDSTGVTHPPLITPQTRFALRLQQFANVRNNLLLLQANKAMSDLKQKAQVEKAVKKHYQQQSDQTRRTYNEPHVQQEQDRANLTPEQELRRDQPQPKPNMDVENAMNNAILYSVPYVGEALMVKDLYNGVKDAVVNGLNLNNGSQIGFSIIPLRAAFPHRLSKISDAEKRFYETGMRTAVDASPFPQAKLTFSEMLKGNQGGMPRLRSIANYIFSGETSGAKGSYNSLAPLNRNGEPMANSGFFPHGKERFPRVIDGKNDMIDAFLYGKEIDPIYEVKKVEPEFGVHSQYIRDNYANKAGDIPVYEMTEMNGFSGESPRISPTGIYRGENRGAVASEIADEVTGHYMPNVGGHRVEKGILDNGEQAIRVLDIWKFLPEEYKNKWGNIYVKAPSNASFYDKFKAAMENSVVNFGLHRINAVGTPIITRSKWVKPDYPWLFPK